MIVLLKASFVDANPGGQRSLPTNYDRVARIWPKALRRYAMSVFRVFHSRISQEAL